MPDDADLWDWVHRANIERYRRLMATPLTTTERRFVERRIREEEAALRMREARAEGEYGAHSH